MILSEFDMWLWQSQLDNTCLVKSSVAQDAMHLYVVLQQQH